MVCLIENLLLADQIELLDVVASSDDILPLLAKVFERSGREDASAHTEQSGVAVPSISIDPPEDIDSPQVNGNGSGTSLHHIVKLRTASINETRTAMNPILEMFEPLR